MRRVALILAALLMPVAMLAQEVVVFKDYRALVVSSHRVQGDWTYLRIGAGEMAVLSSSIVKISNQEQVSQASSVPERPQPAGGPAAAPPPEAGRAWRPQPMRGQSNPGLTPLARPAPSINPPPPDDDDDTPGNAAEDNDDDEPQAPPKVDAPKPGMLKPMQPPGAWPQGNAPQPAPSDTK